MKNQDEEKDRIGGNIQIFNGFFRRKGTEKLEKVHGFGKYPGCDRCIWILCDCLFYQQDFGKS